MAVSANKIELLQIADAVAREKSIPRETVLQSMEDALQKAARSRYGQETEVRAEINPRTGELRFSRLLLVVDMVENDATQITLDDARKREITIPANGANSTPSFYARLLNETLGTKMRIILGYPGQNEMYTAMERGEVDANSSVFYSSLVATRPRWLSEKQVNLLVQYGLDKSPDLGDTPFAPDLVTSEDDKLLMDAAFAPLAVGRPYAMPPGVPAERVKAMQEAFFAMFRDPEFIKDAERQKLDVSTPRSGAQLMEVIRKAYAMPEHIVARLRKLSAVE